MSQKEVYEFNVPTFGRGVVFDVDHTVRAEQFRFFAEARKRINLPYIFFKKMCKIRPAISPACSNRIRYTNIEIILPFSPQHSRSRRRR